MCENYLFTSSKSKFCFQHYIQFFINNNIYCLNLKKIIIMFDDAPSIFKDRCELSFQF